MVEIQVTVADATFVHGLMRRLRRLFNPSAVSYDPAESQVRVRSEWESRTVIAVVDAVQRWMDESGAASASLAVGERSYTLVGSPLETTATDTDREVRALAAISAIVRSAQGANDRITLLSRICEGISRHLGFERAGIARTLPEAEASEAIAAHGWLPQELTDVAASAELQMLQSELKSPDTVVLTRAIAPAFGRGVVVVPLTAAGRSHGLLLLDHGGNAFDLDESERVLLSTLGCVVSALLEKAVAHEELLHTGHYKGDFISLASHELRTPTAAVCGIAATLHERGDLLTADQRRGLSEVLYQQGHRLHSLVDQLLDLSRLEADSIRITPTPLAVRDKTEEIVRGVAAERAGEIELRIDPALLMQADALAFDRIVSNLITNALRYGRQPIAVSASSQDRHFRLSVEDRGPGVPPELEPHLFERFTRGDYASKSGAGLGLSIARAYAHAHGGELLYTDATPHGARFELVVPLASARHLDPVS